MGNIGKVFVKNNDETIISGIVTDCTVCILGETSGCPHFGKQGVIPDECFLNDDNDQGGSNV
jgi:hypothetical protein